MRTQIPPLLLLFFFFLIASSSSASAAVVGGWKKIGDPSNLEIQEIARYAIEEHNKQKPPRLSYHSVVSGQTQVVAGINYRLQILARDPSGAMRRCEAVVWVKAWAHFRQLTSFTIKN